MFDCEMRHVMDKIYWVWLSTKFEYSGNKAVELLRMLKTPKDIYEADKQTLIQTGILSRADVAKLVNKQLNTSEDIIKDCEKKGIDIIAYDDALYPIRFKNIYAPPMVLYVKGDISGIDDEVAIGVVGTRKASDYGKKLTGNLCYELTRAGSVIISGCAVGIDTYAHWGALKAGGRTIAVLGCGLDVNYPAASAKLKKAILKKGALISEVPPGVGASRKIFPIRNRLISGLSLAVLVTEAPFRSGSLITAEHAIEQGKDLFCVPPHDIYDDNFSGVAKYLRDGATPVFSAKDIMFEYYSEYAHKLKAQIVFKTYIVPTKKKNYNTNYKRSENQEIPEIEKTEKPTEYITKEWQNDLSDEHKKVFDYLEFDPIGIDSICYDLDMELNKVLSILTELELYDYVMSFSGRRYSLIKTQK